LLELVAKNIALGPRAYVQDPWNRFDAAVVGLSLAGFVITVATTTTASYLAILRIFRVARAFRWGLVNLPLPAPSSTTL